MVLGNKLEITGQHDAFFTMQPVMNPLLYLTDSYKLSHKNFEIPNVLEIYSNFAVRFDKHIAALVGENWDKLYVVFGVQYAIKELHDLFQKYFFGRPEDEVINEMYFLLFPYLGTHNGELEHFRKLWQLGYLPVEIKALPEGTLAPIGCPFMTVRNTLPEFEWLPNYLESVISTLVWKPLTVATIARHYRLVTNEYALKTTGSLVGTEFQNHDFHVRGASGWQSAGIVGCAFLLSSCGTDNVPSLYAAQQYYNSRNGDELLAGSVAAGEHSVTTLGILTFQELNGVSLQEAEEMYLDYVLHQFPEGIVSYVADSFDYWTFVGKILPKKKHSIMQRNGKFVVRGDSGNPVDVICGVDERDYMEVSLEDAPTFEAFLEWTTDSIREDLRENTPHGEYGSEEWGLHFKWNDKLWYVEITNFEYNRFDKQYYFLEQYAKYNHVAKEIERTVEHKGTIETLWEIFGGTVNDLGYKVLDSRIGMIYGDGITLERQQAILGRLEAKGFASTNIVFGVGSYALNMLSRDHLGMAIKATNAVVKMDGVIVDKPIYKDPKTDTSKKSARGLLSVKCQDGKVVSWKDMCTRQEEAQSDMRVVFLNGGLYNLETLFQIRKRLWG